MVRLVTLRQAIHDVQTTSHECKPNPEVIIENDGLYARAWESECETPISDNGQHKPHSANSLEINVKHDLPIDETSNLPGNVQEDSPEILPHTDEIGDGTDTDHYMEPDAEVNVEPLRPTDIKPRSTKYDLRQNLKPNFNDDYRY